MLKDLNLLPVYDSAEYDLVHDLIVPLLQNSKLYLRGVGYFTSGWLRLAVEGVTGLIDNGGTAGLLYRQFSKDRIGRHSDLGKRQNLTRYLKMFLKNRLSISLLP